MAQYALVKCNINGKDVEKIVDVRASLTDMLRNDFRLTSVKKGCEVGECGACTALIDGEAINTCLYLAVWAEGQAHHHARGSHEPRRHDLRCPAGIHGRNCHPVRLLHARLHPDRHRDREFRQGIHRRRAPEAPLRPPVPLPATRTSSAPSKKPCSAASAKPKKRKTSAETTPRRTAPGVIFRRAAKGSPSRGRFPYRGNVPKGQKG